jgi:hypothetical protein
MVELKVKKAAFTLTGPLSEVMEILRILAQSKLTVAQWLNRANSHQ